MGMVDPELDPMNPPPTPRAVIRFGAIGEAWEFILAQWPVWALTVVVVIAGYSVVAGFAFELLGLRHAGRVGGFRFGIPEGRTAIPFVLGAIISGFFVAGMFRMACRQIRGEPIRLGDLFSVVDVLPELVLGLALDAAALFVAGMFCFIPALIVHGLLMFMIPLLVDGRLTATDAIAQSFHALKGQWLAATIFHAVVSFVSILGMCFFCVGLLLTAPLYVLSITILYRDTFLARKWSSTAKPAPPPGEF